MPDTIKISELDEALAIADAAEFPYTQENGGENTTFKAPLTQIAAKIVEDMSYAGINLPVGAGVKSVENTLNYLLGAVGGNPNENIAPEYDPTETYAKGDYTIYENVLYICTASNGTTGTFDPTAWSQTELAEHTAQNAANVGDLSTLTTSVQSSLVGAVNEVNANKPTNTNANPMFKRLVCGDISISLTANGSKTIIGNDVNLSSAGYSPVAICAMYSNLSNSCAFTSFDAKYTSGVGTFCNIRNLTSSSVSGICNFTVLFARNDVFAQS